MPFHRRSRVRPGGHRFSQVLAGLVRCFFHRPGCRRSATCPKQPRRGGSSLSVEPLEQRMCLSASFYDTYTASWSGAFGGSQYDEVRAAAVDAAGNLIVVGTTFSGGWVSDGYDTTWAGDGDGFVMKLTADGRHVWSTYLGGSLDDGVAGVAVDSDGNIYLAGWTRSTGWISGGFDTSYGGSGDAFVAKLSPDGAYLWGTYLGGSNWDAISAIALDGNGGLFVVGTTSSSGWVHGGFDSTYNGGQFDAFVARLTADGQFRWSTYLGGADRDYGYGLTVTSDALYVVGKTSSANWSSGGEDLTYAGGYDGYLVRLSLTGQHVWSTYLGGGGEDSATGVIAEATQICVTGNTSSEDWPLSGLVAGPQGGRDAFVVALHPGGRTLWGTHVGGSQDDSAFAIGSSGDGSLFIVGSTRSAGWTTNTLEGGAQGGSEGFLAGISSLGELRVAYAFGGSADDTASTLTLLPEGRLIIAGNTYSTPEWPGRRVLGTSGDADGFAMSLMPNDPPVVGELASPSPVLFRPGSLTLWATDVRDPQGLATVASVLFFRDENRNGEWDEQDTLLGQVAPTGDGEAVWELGSEEIATWSLGRYRFFAVAEDELGARSQPATAEVLLTKREYLGVLDVRQVRETELTGERLFYRFVAAHDAGLLVTSPAATDPVTWRFALYEGDALADPSRPPLAVSTVVENTVRLEALSLRAGTTYELVLEVDHANPGDSLSWQAINLLSRDEGAGEFVLYSTSGDDTWRVSWREDSNGDYLAVVTLQDLEFPFPQLDGGPQRVTLLGGQGHDVVLVTDSPTDDRLVAYPDRTVLETGNFASAGEPRVASSFQITARDFGEVHVYGTQAGHDQAIIYDRLYETGADLGGKMKDEPALGHVKVITARSLIRVKFFEEVDVYAGGSNDLAIFFDGPGDDLFEGRMGMSRRIGPGYTVRGHGFSRVLAYGGNGGDRAKLVDSALKDELQFKPHKVELFDLITGGFEYRVTVRGFPFVEAESAAGSGRDKASLWDTPQDDRILATAEEMIFARLLVGSTRPVLAVRGFEMAKVRDSSGGYDEATVEAPLNYELVFGLGWHVNGGGW